MLKKIISGGQTGADRAALDFAIKHKIPHGGWVPKGRIAEDGPLPKKYKLTEMPTDSYHKRTEMNVIGSDGTIIFSHGKLTGGSAYTRTMAKRLNKPHLHIDLNETDIFQASLLMLEWIDEQEIKTLNVAGPRESKDPKIYERVTDVLAIFSGVAVALAALLAWIMSRSVMRVSLARPALEQALRGPFHSDGGALGNTEWIGQVLYTWDLIPFRTPLCPAAGVDDRGRGAGPPVGVTTMLHMGWVLWVSLGMLTIGANGVMVRRNALVMFMSVELILSAGNLNFIGFSRFLPDPVGQVFSIFIIVIAAAEVAVGLAIVLALYRNRDSVMVDEASQLKWWGRADATVVVVDPDSAAGGVRAGGDAGGVWSAAGPGGAPIGGGGVGVGVRAVGLNANGTIDTSFDAGNLFTRPVLTLAAQPNGQFLVGGAFTGVGEAGQNYLVRLNSDGILDTNFMAGLSGLDNQVNVVTLQADGRILAGGNFTSVHGANRSHIASFTSSGALDPSFAPAAGANGPVRALALGLDGSILLAGDFPVVNSISPSHIARLTSTGELDSTFNPGLGADDSIRALKLLPARHAEQSRGLTGTEASSPEAEELAPG